MRPVPMLLLLAIAACSPRPDDAESIAADSSHALTAVPAPAVEPEQTDSKRDRNPDQPGSTPPATSEPALQGRIRVTGTAVEPLTTVETSGGPVLIRGPLEPELRTLDGMTVRVSGRQAGTSTRTIEADGYSIVEADGQPATIGTVTDDGASLIVRADTVLLVAPPAGLQPGARVWVAGIRTGNQLRVSSYGVIRAPK